MVKARKRKATAQQRHRDEQNPLLQSLCDLLGSSHSHSYTLPVKVKALQTRLDLAQQERDMSRDLRIQAALNGSALKTQRDTIKEQGERIQELEKKLEAASW